MQKMLFTGMMIMWPYMLHVSWLLFSIVYMLCYRSAFIKCYIFCYCFFFRFTWITYQHFRIVHLYFCMCDINVLSAQTLIFRWRRGWSGESNIFRTVQNGWTICFLSEKGWCKTWWQSSWWVLLVGDIILVIIIG